MEKSIILVENMSNTEHRMKRPAVAHKSMNLMSRDVFSSRKKTEKNDAILVTFGGVIVTEID